MAGLADWGDALDTRGGGIAASKVRHARQALGHEHVSEALALTDSALALLPHYMFARFVHGQPSMADSHYDDAISDFAQMIAAHPEYPTVYMFRGLAELRARRPEQAIGDFNRALTAQVGMGDELASMVFFYRGLAWQLLGRDEAAIADFQRGLQPLAGRTDDYDTLALTCYTAAVVDLVKTAQLACEQSISRSARNILAYEARGLADLKQAAWDGAIADDTQSLYYRVDQPIALYGRGLAKRAKGDRAGAANDIKAATDIEPDIMPIMARLGVKATK